MHFSWFLAPQRGPSGAILSRHGGQTGPIRPRLKLKPPPWDCQPTTGRGPLHRRHRLHHVPAHVARKEDRQGSGQAKATHEWVHVVRQEIQAGADTATPGQR